MARGYPDFFGYSTFPWYGALKVLTQDPAIAPTAGITYFIDAQYKGRTYGGWIFVVFANWDPGGCIMHWEIDGEVYVQATCLAEQTYGLWQSNDNPLKMVNYSPESRHIEYVVQKEWTFSQRLRIGVNNVTGGNINVLSRVLVAQVT